MKREQGLVRTLRIFVLLVILAAVAGEAWLVRLRTTDWDAPLWVAVYPINADGRQQTAAYIAGLDDAAFADIEAYFRQQAQQHGVRLQQPFVVRLAGAIEAVPPLPPQAEQPLRVMWWSLRLRFWAWRAADNPADPPADIRMFVNYHDPGTTPRLRHSLGLQKGLIGVVNAYADRDYAGQNNVVIAHEMLHTLGATDKYDLATNQPLFPVGYAEPEREPRYPQRLAELMAGRIPVAPAAAQLPGGLRRTLIGALTAREINWPGAAD